MKSELSSFKKIAAVVAFGTATVAVVHAADITAVAFAIVCLGALTIATSLLRPAAEPKPIPIRVERRRR